MLFVSCVMGRSFLLLIRGFVPLLVCITFVCVECVCSVKTESGVIHVAGGADIMLVVVLRHEGGFVCCLAWFSARAVGVDLVVVCLARSVTCCALLHKRLCVGLYKLRPLLGGVLVFVGLLRSADGLGPPLL